MNINKIIAACITLFIFLVPFRYIFLDDTRIISTGTQMLLFLASLIGFLLAFGISTNEPFGRNKHKTQPVENTEEKKYRKAA